MLGMQRIRRYGSNLLKIQHKKREETKLLCFNGFCCKVKLSEQKSILVIKIKYIPERQN